MLSDYRLSICLVLLATTTILPVQAAINDQQNDPLKESVQEAPNTDSQRTTEQEKRLDILFERLASSETPSEADQLIAEIWSIWKTPVNDKLMIQMRQAEALYVEEKYDEAFAILDAAVKTYPKYSEIWNQRATYYYFVGRYDESLADIAKVLELEPRHFGALSGKIAILLLQKKPAAALHVLRKAIQINPFMPQRHMLQEKQPPQKKKPEGMAI